MDYYTVANSFLCCWVLYYLALAGVEDWVRLPRGAKEKPCSIASRWVSMFHALYVAHESTVLWWYWKDGVTDPTWLLSVAMGYFLWDLVLSTIYHDQFGWDMAIHALICVIGYYVSMLPFMQYQAVALLMFEWSTPFLQGTQIARNYKYIATSVVLSGSFVVLFILFRVLWGSYFILGHIVPEAWEQRHLNHWALTTWTIVGTLTSECLNLYWFSNIMHRVNMIKPR